MGGELVTASQLFYECLPRYLELGMSPDEYWNGDCCLVKSYRKAEELRLKRVNAEAYLQGRYFYDALISASPILNAFSKATEPLPYLEEPHPLTEEERKEREYNRKRKAYEQMIADLDKQVKKWAII